MTYRIIIFLILNFATLGLSRFLGGEGPKSEWYASIETAPWTPSGMVIGIAWTTTMIGFSIYLAYLWPVVANKNLLMGLLALHYLLSLVWNPTFFYYHQVLAGLFVLTALTIVVAFILFFYWPELKLKSLLIAPYLFWIMIATALNAYVFINN